jgi:hypothetical protein
MYQAKWALSGLVALAFVVAMSNAQTAQATQTNYNWYACKTAATTLCKNVRSTLTCCGAKWDRSKQEWCYPSSGCYADLCRKLACLDYICTEIKRCCDCRCYEDLCYWCAKIAYAYQECECAYRDACGCKNIRAVTTYWGNCVKAYCAFKKCCPCDCGLNGIPA